ncbi:MAG: hypothetical protein MR487_08195 [Lachnospiraceae bacterium]|nr:hypothetical protein [Lachnospiraceae bacterium]
MNETHVLQIVEVLYQSYLYALQYMGLLFVCRVRFAEPENRLRQAERFVANEDGL